MKKRDRINPSHPVDCATGTRHTRWPSPGEKSSPAIISRPQAETGESEESSDGEVMKQHGGDEPSRGPAWHVRACQQADDFQNNQCDAGDALIHSGDAETRPTEHQPH